MRWLKIAWFATVALSRALLSGSETPATNSSLALPEGLYAEFSTPKGAITVQLFAKEAPMTVTNFVGLAEGTLGPKRGGQPYYSGLRWYRVVPDFVIQSGNPSHPADGDAGYVFPDEFVPGLRHDEAGILSMANAGPDTNSAEFFITLGNQTRLNYLHSVFGRVVRGIERLPQIAQDDSFTIKILRIGRVAQAFKADEATFKALIGQARPYGTETEPGSAAHFDDPDHLLPVNPPRARAFNYKLNNFERATGTRIVARLFAHSPPAAEDEIPGAFMRALAEKLGVARRGVLAAYFAADDDWRIWIGDESTPAFLGRAARAEDLVEDGALHKAKEAFLEATRAAGDAAFDAQQKKAPDDTVTLPAQRLKLQTDAMLDRLVFKLEPPAKN